MKLIQALELGKEAGLETLAEAKLNIEMHSISLFSYNDIPKEIRELDEECNRLYSNGFTLHDKIDDILYSLLGKE